MSSADPTLADRARRHRARKAEEDATMAQAVTRLAELLERLTIAVEALRNGGGPAVDNRASTHGQNSTIVAQRSGRRKPDAHARTEGAPPPPTGAVGATTEEELIDDGELILGVLTRPGSLAAIVDAVDLPRTRTAAALVYLQGHGLVRREEGSGLVPDRWRRVEGATLELLADHPARPLQVEPAPTTTVDCREYQAHASAHRWDQALARFRCATCEPSPMAARPSPPPGVGRAASPAPGGLAHG